MVNVNSDKEWIRRRKMRLMQVRKQSSDIAKMLRERVVDEEIQRKVAEEQEMELNLKLWKFRRLNDLEEMYRNAIRDFGVGHELASKEPVSEKLDREKEYLSRAKKRGECALQQELKIKEEADKKKALPIQRKLVTRKIEDLRSMLVRSIDVKKSSVFPRNICVEKVFDPKLFESRDEIEEPDIEECSHQERKTGTKKQLHPVKVTFQDELIRKKSSGKKEKGRKKKMLEKEQDKPEPKCEEQKKSGSVKEETSKLNSLGSERLWVDLGVIEVSTENEEVEKKEVESIPLKIEKDCRKEKGVNTKEKTAKKEKKTLPKKEEGVECRGYSFSRNCNLKENTGLVQRMDNHSEPNAVELALREEEKLLLRTDEEKNRRTVAKERGSRAILKEKVNRSFTELLTKLEKLTAKEKLIKTYCHLPPSHVFYSDDRRQEKLSKKQQKMDSEFERIYYDVKGVNPECNSRSEFNAGACARDFGSDDDHGDLVTKLNLSRLESDLKGNGRACDSCGGNEKEQSNTVRSPIEKVTIKKTPSSFRYKRTKIVKGGKKTISDIDKILEKSRKLRKESVRSSGLPPRECKSDNDFSDRKSDKKEENNSEAREMSLGSLTSGSIELALNKLGSSSASEGDRVSDILNGLKKSLEPKPSSDPSKAILEDLGMGDLGINFPHVRNVVAAWPIHGIDRTSESCDNDFGNTTSYFSLPEEVNTEKFRELMESLDDLRGRGPTSKLTDQQLERLEDVLCSVMGELDVSNATSCKDDSLNFDDSSDLSDYISRLLDMSREQLSKLLNSSSESEGSPKYHDSLECSKSQIRLSSEGKCPSMSPECSQSPQQATAKELDGIISKWKGVLEQVLENSPPPDRSNQFGCDKTYVKCTKKTSERQSKSRERFTPKTKVRSSEFSSSTRNSCSEREISAGSSIGRCDKARDQSSERKASPPCEAREPTPREPMEDNAECKPPLNEPLKVFICDERSCPYVRLGVAGHHGGKGKGKGNACDKSYTTPDAPANRTYNVSQCKFGCPSPCPGHTGLLNRRSFFNEMPECRVPARRIRRDRIQYSLGPHMNYVDAAQGIYSPLHSADKYILLRGQQLEKNKFVPPGFIDKPKERFDWDHAPDWYDYAPGPVWNAHRPFMRLSGRTYTGERFHQGGRIWSKDTEIVHPPSPPQKNKFESTWSDEDMEKFEETNKYGTPDDWMMIETEKTRRKAEQRKRDNFDCHGHEADCNSDCKKDILTTTLKRLKKQWLESQRPTEAQVKAARSCYHACAVHCQRPKNDSDESDDYSSSDFDSSLEHSCGNLCPSHCWANPPSFVSSDDEGSPKPPGEREKKAACAKAVERPKPPPPPEMKKYTKPCPDEDPDAYVKELGFRNILMEMARVP